MSEPAAKPKSSWLNLLVDYGPLLVFFLAYRWSKPDEGGGIGEVLAVTKSTVAFMIATVIALVVSKWRLGKVSPMLWLSAPITSTTTGRTSRSEPAPELPPWSSRIRFHCAV